METSFEGRARGERFAWVDKVQALSMLSIAVNHKIGADTHWWRSCVIRPLTGRQNNERSIQRRREGEGGGSRGSRSPNLDLKNSRFVDVRVMEASNDATRRHASADRLQLESTYRLLLYPPCLRYVSLSAVSLSYAIQPFLFFFFFFSFSIKERLIIVHYKYTNRVTLFR